MREEIDKAKRSRRWSRVPPWLVGFFVAVIVFAVVLFLLDLFGYGDDPVMDSSAVVQVL